MSDLPDRSEPVIVLVEDRTTLLAAMRVIEAAGLSGCVQVVEAEPAVPHAPMMRESIIDLLAADDFRDVILKNPAAIAEPFIERERPERDWKQRERQRPRRRRR